MVRVQPSTPPGAAPTRAAVRAAQQKKRSLILVGVILVLVVALVAVLGVIFVRGFPGASAQQPTSGGECLPASLRITADPAVAKALESIVADLTGPRTDCPEVSIRAEDSAVTAAAITEGTAPDFDVWVPDSAMWPARATGMAELREVDAADLVVSGTMASTPVVFATTEDTATALESEGVGFASLAGGTVSAVLPDPAAVAGSSAALLALQTAVGGDARVFTALALGLERGVVATAADALAAMNTPVMLETWTPPAEGDRLRVANGVRMLYPHDLRDGEHGFTVVSCVGTQALAVLDGDDEVDYVLDLGTLKGRRITLGPFTSPAAAFQNSLF